MKKKLDFNFYIYIFFFLKEFSYVLLVNLAQLVGAMQIKLRPPQKKRLKNYPRKLSSVGKGNA